MGVENRFFWESIGVRLWKLRKDIELSSTMNWWTVNDLYMHFAGKDQAIGVTTLYRHLQRMIGEGIVSKYAVGTTGAACFEYVGGNESGETANAYHCKCEGCGKLIHVYCDKIMDIEKHLEEEHGFEVDPFRTVFYGLCGDCMSEASDK